MPEPQPIKSAYNSRPYKDTALAAARAQSLAPEQVMDLDYPGTAALAGVTIKPDGSSPMSFVPSVIRKFVAGQLRAELRDAFWEGIRVHNEAEVRKVPGNEECTLVMSAPGHFDVLDKDGNPVGVWSIF